MKPTIIKQISKFFSVILILAFFLTGCTINDSLDCGEELDLLKMHPEDKVYKIYYGVGWPKFFGKLYNGEVSLGSINEKLDIEHINDPEYQDELEDVCCVGYGYVVKCTENVGERYISSCMIYKEAPAIMHYIYDTELVFDSSVTIKEAYILAEESTHERTEYIYFVTDEGDYIFILNREYVDGHPKTFYYLFPADEFGKHCAEEWTKLEENGEQIYSKPDFVTSFENYESYRHTEPYKPE